PPWADAHVTYDTAQAIVDRHALDIQLSGPPQFFALRGPKKYGVFPLGNVLALVPSYVVYKILRTIPGLPDRPLFALTSHLSSSLMMAGACALFYLLCRRRRATEGWAVVMTLVLGLGTICLIYARSPYSEALQTLALMWLVERTHSQAERPTPSGMAG